MFLDFFYTLRGLDVKVGSTEWLLLLEALDKGLHRDNLDDFYYLARSILIKDETEYDAFDQAFAHQFGTGGVPGKLATKEEILKWLEDGLDQLEISREDLANMQHFTVEELLAELEERLRTQDGAHHGGHHWIGTGGTSPFGMRGVHPTGISFAPEGGGGKAVMQAFKRKYKNLRDDLTLDVRQMSVALKKLRDLRKEGADEHLDIDATVDATCRDGGEISLVFGHERENAIRLILAMDTGGSMEPYRRLCEMLFSAANSINHFKEFKPYYFHNCVYQNLYSDLERDEYVTVERLLRDSTGENYRLVVVGDAAMAPYELMIPNGTLERKRLSRVKGIDRLKALARAYPKRAWLNPMPERSWAMNQTVKTVRELFPMYPLTLAGLDHAVKSLR